MLENKEVQENIQKIREKIETLTKERGTPCVLLAATKTVPVEQINFAIDECHITDIGENRVQELLSKYESLHKNVRLHFIGKLQKNKVKYIIDKVCLIHSVDTVALAAEIEKQASKIGKTMEILLEVNSGREQQKSGFMPEEVEAAAEEISAFPHVRIKGLMTIAPVCIKKEDYSRYFQETYQIFLDISRKKRHNIDMSILSMGMTDSMEEAIRSSSTMVRIGSGIFGKRENQNNRLK